MYYEIIELNFLQEYKIELIFKDGNKGIVDFQEYIGKGGVFNNFSDIKFFRSCFINPESGVLTWPGDLDIAPETLYSKATGKPLPGWVEET